MRKIIDISGFGHSGKSSLFDYLRQYDEVFSFPVNVEFELLRLPDGLIDLHCALDYSWSPIRSNLRLKKFRELVYKLGINTTLFRPTSLFIGNGNNYNSYFNNEFVKISERFIDELVLLEFKTYWPYEDFEKSGFRLFSNKVLRRFFPDIDMHDVKLTSILDFEKKVNRYIQDLFDVVCLDNHSHVMLTNALEPYNPSIGLDLLGDGFSIIVDRDPRDVFCSLIDLNQQFVPSFDKSRKSLWIKRKMVAFDNVDLFILKYRLFRNNISILDDSRVLRVNFESFILDHDRVAMQIKDFVGIPQAVFKESKYFSTTDSVKNIGLYKKYENLPELVKISRELSEYCFNS
jgi:hypothetical protein